MRIEAIGTDVRAHRDGTLTVTAQLLDHDSGRSEMVHVTGTTLDDVRQQLNELMQQRLDLARDAALRAAVVGQMLASAED